MSETELIQTEPVTARQVAVAQKMAGTGAMFMDFHKVDLTVGRGILEGNDRCLWTTDGYRILIGVSRDGGVIMTQGSEPDPMYALLKAAQEPAGE